MNLSEANWCKNKNERASDKQFNVKIAFYFHLFILWAELVLHGIFVM